MKRILVSALLLLSLAVSFVLPAFAEPTALSLSAEGGLQNACSCAAEQEALSMVSSFIAK